MTSGQPTQPPPERLLGAYLVFYDISGDALLWEISMASQTAPVYPSCLGKGMFTTLFVVLPLKNMLVFLKALVELGMIFPRRICMDFFLSSDRRRLLEIL